MVTMGAAGTGALEGIREGARDVARDVTERTLRGAGQLYVMQLTWSTFSGPISSAFRATEVVERGKKAGSDAFEAAAKELNKEFPVPEDRWIYDSYTYQSIIIVFRLPCAYEKVKEFTKYLHDHRPLLPDIDATLEGVGAAPISKLMTFKCKSSGKVECVAAICSSILEAEHLFDDRQSTAHNTGIFLWNIPEEEYEKIAKLDVSYR